MRIPRNPKNNLKPIKYLIPSKLGSPQGKQTAENYSSIFSDNYFKYETKKIFCRCQISPLILKTKRKRRNISFECDIFVPAAKV